MSRYPDDFRGVLPGEDTIGDDDLAAALDEAFGIAGRAGMVQALGEQGQILRIGLLPEPFRCGPMQAALAVFSQEPQDGLAREFVAWKKPFTGRADVIVAPRTSIVGSIGVVGGKIVFDDALRELGVNAATFPASQGEAGGTFHARNAASRF